MKPPTTTKGLLKLLIAIAEKGNEYYDKRLTVEDELEIGGLIADLQNNLGEMKATLDKLNIKYDSSL